MMNHQNNDKRRLSTTYKSLLISLIIYAAISAILLIVFSPLIRDVLYNVIFYNLSHTEILYISVFLLLFLLTTITLIIFYFGRYREIRSQEANISNDNVAETYGNYSDQRRYLEKKIDELTTRLSDTEDKWVKLNHLLLSANENNFLQQGNLSSKNFLSGFGIDLASIKIDKKMVFVLTPSDREYFEDYLAVRKACHERRLQAIRGDDEDLDYKGRNILSYIIEHILTAHVVIANISNRNPNVFYEIGIAHMAGKPTILLCRANESIPFDLQQKYVVFYQSEEELSTKLKNELISILADANN